jgi:hypothetical protein
MGYMSKGVTNNALASKRNVGWLLFSLLPCLALFCNITIFYCDVILSHSKSIFGQFFPKKIGKLTNEKNAAARRM